jgi:hypothetical protein
LGDKLVIIVLPIGGVDKSGQVILAKMPGWFGKKGHPFPGDLGYTPAIGRAAGSSRKGSPHALLADTMRASAAAVA